VTDSASEPAATPAPEERPDELVVHTPCGRIRGPVLGYWLRPRRMLFQQCCVDGPLERWPRADVSRVHDLCVLCARGLAGGITRWSHLACTTCRSVLRASDDPQVALLPVGWHSIMNAAAVQVFASERNVRVQQSAMLQGFNVQFQMYDWCKLETAALAAEHFPGAVSVPLTEWQTKSPAETRYSEDAAARFMAWVARGRG
jgi:hypothetical protein